MSSDEWPTAERTETANHIGIEFLERSPGIDNIPRLVRTINNL